MNITAAVKKYTPLRLLASYTPCDLMKKIDSDSTSTSCIDHLPSHSNARRWRERAAQLLLRAASKAAAGGAVRGSAGMIEKISTVTRREKVCPERIRALTVEISEMLVGEEARTW